MRDPFAPAREFAYAALAMASRKGGPRWRSDIEAFHAKLEAQRAALASEGRKMRVVRLPWSREPGEPAYPVRPWHERPVIIGLMIFGGTAVVTLVAIVAWRVVRARRRAVAEQGAGT